MLRTVKRHRTRATAGTFAIVASQYNRRYVDGMLRAASATLRAAGVRKIIVVRVPGAFEIPVVTARLARAQQRPLAAVLCLGVVLRGETSHAQHIGQSVSHALAQIQIQQEIPVIHEVLLLENEGQAKARCLGRRYNRGAEAAQTALSMSRIMKRLAQ